MKARLLEAARWCSNERPERDTRLGSALHYHLVTAELAEYIKQVRKERNGYRNGQSSAGAGADRLYTALMA